VAYGFWVAAIVMCVLACAVNSPSLGRLSLLSTGVAATATIRSYFITLAVRIKAALIVAATEGREVRPIR
jgi:hypothetical protein